MINELKEPRIEDLERVLVDKGSKIERWAWRIKGTRIWHHPTQPAVQWTDGDWDWYWMDREHRWDGPARWRGGRYQYCIYGDYITRGRWERDPRRLEWLKKRSLEI